MLSYDTTLTEPQPSLPNLGSILGIQIGMDNSGNFALSLNGLAIRRPDGRFVTMVRDQLLDVTLFTLSGINPMVFRVPVPSVSRNDLIIISDFPFRPLYVLETSDEPGVGIVGLDPFSGETSAYSPVENLFLNFFVRVVSLFDLLEARRQ